MGLIWSEWASDYIHTIKQQRRTRSWTGKGWPNRAWVAENDLDGEQPADEEEWEELEESASRSDLADEQQVQNPSALNLSDDDFEADMALELKERVQVKILDKL